MSLGLKPNAILSPCSYNSFFVALARVLLTNHSIVHPVRSVIIMFDVYHNWHVTVHLDIVVNFSVGQSSA